MSALGKLAFFGAVLWLGALIGRRRTLKGRRTYWYMTLSLRGDLFFATAGLYGGIVLALSGGAGLAMGLLLSSAVAAWVIAVVLALTLAAPAFTRARCRYEADLETARPLRQARYPNDPHDWQ
jgi:hypothetical protein